MAVETPLNGRWVTMRGRPVFIKAGQTPAQALEASLQGDGYKAGGAEGGMQVKGKAKVTVEDQPKVDFKMEYFDKKLDDVIAAAVPDQDLFDKITVRVDGPTLHVIGTSSTHSKDQMYLHRSFRSFGDDFVLQQEAFLLPESLRGQGKGSEVFAAQVKNATKLGVTRIETWAARGDDSSTNGYYTWPRLGYDRPMPSELKGKVAAAGFTAPRISDLMKTPEGRGWWKENGIGIDMEFDLAPDSLSRRVLDAYLAERRK